jgi:hypothetical protein
MFLILDIFFLTEKLPQNLLQPEYPTMYMKIINFISFYLLHDVFLMSKTVCFIQTAILLFIVIPLAIVNTNFYGTAEKLLGKVTAYNKEHEGMSRVVVHSMETRLVTEEVMTESMGACPGER